MTRTTSLKHEDESRQPKREPPDVCNERWYGIGIAQTGLASLRSTVGSRSPDRFSSFFSIFLLFSDFGNFF